MELHTELEYVGFWLRVWASVIDTFLICLILVPFLIYFLGLDGIVSNNDLQGGASFLVYYLIPAIIVLLFWQSKQATPGKIAISAMIVDSKTGGRPTMSQQIIRYLGYFISSIFFLGFIWVAFDRRKQGWHDKMAGTVVVRPLKGGRLPVSFDGV